MPTNPYAVQLAIQGGGAKLMALLAALEAVQALQAEGMIHVTRIAGTSAGAIAGAIFAAGIPMSTAKEHFRADFHNKIERYFPSPSYVRLYQLVKGNQLWDTTPLRTSLRRLLEPTGVVTFEDLEKAGKPKMIVVAANLVQSRKVAYTSGELIDALLHSSALPYCFRVWNKNDNPVIVDGGICENLPSDELEQDETSGEGPIVAISFKSVSGRPPKNIGHFSMALLDTSISNSMARAKQRLGMDHVHEIDTNLTTFDFQAALNIGDSEYRGIKTECELFFRNFVKPRLAGAALRKDLEVDPDIWKQQNLAMMETLGRVFQGQHLNSKIRYQKCTLQVQSEDLNEGDDSVTYRTVYKAATKPLYCLGFTLISPGAEFLKHRVSNVDQLQNPVRVEIMPFREPGGRSTHQLLVFLIPPLELDGGPYTMEVQQKARGFMLDKKLVYVPNRADGPVAQIDLVLHTPEALGDVRLAGMEGSEGRELRQHELPEGARPPIGYRGVGWRGENRPPERPFGAEVLLGQRP